MKQIKDFALFLAGCLIACIVPITFIITFTVGTVVTVACIAAIILLHAWAAITAIVVALINGDDLIASIRRSQRITRHKLIKKIKALYKF